MTNDNLRILVVDDSSLIRGIIRRELEAGGYKIEEAVHGFEALAKAATFFPDLITLDVEMPKLNGFDTCRKFRELHYARFCSRSRENKVPIIFVTSHDTINDRKKGFELEAMDFIVKPFENGTLLKAVNKILRPENRLHGLTALVVSDRNDLRGMVSNCLLREGVTTIEAADGIQAFEIIKKRTADIDIIISGLIIPNMRGDELCKKVRNELNLNDLPFIILPVVDDKIEVFESFKLGITDYLVLPFVKEELLARLIVHLERVQLNKSLRNTVKQVEGFNKSLETTIKILTDIGASLTSEKNLNKLLEMVVSKAQDITNSDGGTLYILKNNQLHFEIVHYKSLNIYMGGENGEPVIFSPISLNKMNLSAFFTVEKIMNIPDVYEKSEFDILMPKKFEETFGYKTKSMLLLPMLNHNNEIVGILQLINSIDPKTGEFCEFPKNTIDIAYSLSCQAAVCIENALSYEKIGKKNIVLKRFVPNEFLSFLHKSEIEDIHLGEAAEEELSVLFLDIRSFTDMSEKMTPVENFNFLNNYLKFIGPIINKHNGFIDKYIGDAIMALFGRKHYSGAQEALTAAINIQKKLKLYNIHREKTGDFPIRVGIGINTGKMMLGIIGFESRMEGTVIGDTVNLASRLETLTKKYTISITISSFTLNSLDQPEKFFLREIGMVRIKGKQEVVTVYEVFDSDDEAIRNAKQETLAQYNEGVSLFKQHKWRQSNVMFTELREKLPTDMVIKIYEERSRMFAENPPASHEMIVI